MVRLEYAYGVCPKCKVNNYLRYLIHNDGLIHKPYEIKCINCNSYFAKEDIFGSGEELVPMPKTNADRIRGMTGEELAVLLASVNGFSVKLCETSWSEWLKREVKEGE